MNILNDFSLLNYNTFGIDVKADTFIDFQSVEALQMALKMATKPILPVGSGSNLLFLSDFHGSVLHSSIRGIEVVKEDENEVILRVGSGEEWDDIANFAAINNWWGAENLSGIPGSVGASAIQNIGAYGAEAKDIIECVEAVSVADGSIRTFSNSECRYAYRDSIFKNELRGSYVITYVEYRLSKSRRENIEYGALREALSSTTTINAITVREKVIELRNSKLPNPKLLGNAGSFFMNPSIDIELFERIRTSYPNVPFYSLPDSRVKIPAAWLIEQCGWKGRAMGRAAVHKQQALVLVNLGGAKGRDIKRLSDAIVEDVKREFGITLVAEVNFIGE